MTTPTGILFYEPRAKPLSSIGLIQPGCYYQFYLTSTTTLANVYGDGALTSILSQTPGTGQTTAASDGRLIPIYMNPAVIYRVQLYDSLGTLLEDVDPYIPTYSPAITQTQIGQILWPRTAAEISASVTPTSFAYPPGDVRRYGAVGDGVTDDSGAVNAALSVQQDVFIQNGLNCLVVSGISLQFDNQTLYGTGFKSQISCAGTNISTVTINGRNRASVRDLFISYTGSTSSGVTGAAVFIGSSSNECSVSRCRLQGGRAGVTLNTATNCWVSDNLIDSISPPDIGWDIGVYLVGSHNVISRNKCLGGVGPGGTGTTGIFIQSGTSTACDWNIVANNEVGTHSQYGIILYAGTGGSAQHNTVTGNLVHDITGTYNSGGGLVFGAGLYIQAAEWTTVGNNFFYNTNVSTTTQSLAPGAIGVNGTSCFSLTGNVIRFPQWYGIYITGDGNGSGGGEVVGNVITSPIKDGIGISTISNVSIIGNSIFGGSQHGISYTNAGIGTGIAIQNNKIKNCSSGDGLHLTGLLQCPNISGNYISVSANGLIMTNTIGAIITGNEFRNNTSNDCFFDNTNSGLIHFDRNTVRSTATNGVNDSVGLCYGINDVAGQTNVYAGTFPYERVLATSATPSVAGSLSVSYGGATAVTDLTGGYTGQRVTIRASGSITLNNNAGSPSTKLINRAGANLSLTSGQTATYELAPGGPWYQIN